ncbi:MAG TPA: L-threonylcarbamoyladenylate synthase [Mycobacteriales bacterium]|nr:L-threonylcarbamoyladenylate synthase [Mycobacteriales bacterium]
MSTIEEAATAVRSGQLVVVPTDTVYGVGADAFDPSAVNALLAAKGRGRDMPVPVLIGSWQTLDGIAASVSPTTRALVEAFWPGPLSLLLRHQPSLAWDLGDARGTVLVRMPLHPMALELLAITGPMAVSSANRSGQPAATTMVEARAQLGSAVAVYLDGGPTAGPVPSTIVDVSHPSEPPRVLRLGGVTVERLREVVPELVG